MDSGYESEDEQCEDIDLVESIAAMKETYANLALATKALGYYVDEARFTEGYNIPLKYLKNRCCDTCFVTMMYSNNYFPSEIRYFLNRCVKTKS